MIQVRGLTKNFGGIRAIDGLDFTVEAGEILGFLGPNGAGKTTTMRILTGLLQPSTGTARVAGLDCFTDSEKLKSRIGYMPENISFYDDMKVTEYLSFVATLRGIDARGLKQSLESVIIETGLSSVKARLIGRLSKGFRQRVGLAQALLGEHDLLILDEPTIGLDPRQIVEIRELIRKLAGSRTIILSTHILPEVEMLCDRVLIIDKGRLVAMDTPSGLKSKFSKSSRIILRIGGKADKIVEGIEGLKAVRSVESISIDNNLTELVIELKDSSDDPSPLIAEMVLRHGLKLLEIKSLAPSLEDVFLRLVTSEELAK
jgi:ABC-2 type transport system ATP-binding protein